MPIVYTTAAKNARMTAVRDLIDAGEGPGVLQIGTAGMAAVLAEIPLGDPCGTVANGVLTLDGFPRSDTAANDAGTAAAARIRDSDGNDVITGLTVGTDAADIILDTVTVAANQTVTITGASITHA